MTGSMYAAIAGMKTHMTKMNVIGNNIANVNTSGYKSQRTVFKDAMYTVYRSGSDGDSTNGGRNAAQIGYGSQVSTIDLNMSSGSYAPGNTMDCMIDGDGFFLVGDKTTGDNIDVQNPNTLKSLSLTRVGDFTFDANGYLVDGNGSCVYGFLSVGTDTDGNPIVTDQLAAIRLPKVETVSYDAAGNVIPAGSNTPVDHTETEIRYPVVAEANNAPVMGNDLVDSNVTSTACKLQDYDDYVNNQQAANNGTATTQLSLSFAQLDSISISSNGQISGTVKDSDEVIVIGYLAIGNVTNTNGVSHDGGFYYKAGDGAGDLQVSLMGGIASDAKTVGGGTLEYVNGSLAAAAGNNGGTAITPSERFRIGSAGTTQILSGGLEGSNVDLATEISEMITTQRGYQANTRIITVTDSMLEELVNMKR